MECGSEAAAFLPEFQGGSFAAELRCAFVRPTQVWKFPSKFMVELLVVNRVSGGKV